MDESAHRTKPNAEEPTPEVAQLLKLLDLQAASRRRGVAVPEAFHGNAFRYGSLIAIVLFAIGSVVVMEWFVSQIPRPAHPAVASSTPGATQAGPGLQGATPSPDSR